MLVTGVTNLQDDESVPGWLLIGFGLALLGFVTHQYRTPQFLPPRHHRDEPGLLLPVRPPGAVATVVFALLALLLFAGAASGIYLVVAEGDASGAVVVVGGLVLGTVFAAGAVGSVRQRRAADVGILLTPDAVLLRTRREPITIRWRDVVAIRDHWNRAFRWGLTTPDDLIRNWLTFEVAQPRGDALSLMSGSASPSVDAATLSDPERMLAICRHYLDHSDDRAELGTAAAVERWT